MTTDKTSSKTRGSALTALLPGAYRRPKKNAGSFAIYWYEDRHKGADLLATFTGATREAAEAAEQKGFPALAAKYEASRKPKLNPSFMRALIRDFEEAEFPGMADSTRTVWRGHLRKIEDEFGNISLQGMQQMPDPNNPSRRTARQLVTAWHKKTGKLDPETKKYQQPRTANYRLTVLVRVLNWGVDQERLKDNRAKGIKRLPEGPGRASITWRPDELDAFLKHCPAHVARGIRLAALTGFRMEDVIRAQVSDIEADVIRRPTSKSRGKQSATVPLYPALRALLEECIADGRQVGPIILNTSGGGWKSASGFDSSMRPAIDDYREAGGVEKHFHDLRGNAATAMYLGGVSQRLIGLAMGWTEDEVPNRIRDYVDMDSVARAMATAENAGRTVHTGQAGSK